MRNLIRSTIVTSIICIVTSLGPLSVSNAVPPGQATGGVASGGVANGGVGTDGWLCRLLNLC